MLSLLCSLALAQEPIELPPKAALLAPLGVPQFVFERPVLGASTGGVQVAGLALAVISTRKMTLADEDERFEDAVRWRFVSAGGVAAVAASYFISVMLGSRDYQLREALMLSQGPSAEQRAMAALSWQTRRLYAETLVLP